MNLLNLNNYGPKNNKGSRYISVVIENFGNFGWTVPLKKCSKNETFDCKKSQFLEKQTNFNSE